MGAPKIEVNFNCYWSFLKKYALLEKRLSKGEWMVRSGLSYRRFSEYDKAKRDITPHIFVRLCGGVELDPMEVASRSGKAFSKAQAAEIVLQKQIMANMDFLRILFSDPELLATAKRIVDLRKSKKK